MLHLLRFWDDEVSSIRTVDRRSGPYASDGKAFGPEDGARVMDMFSLETLEKKELFSCPRMKTLHYVAVLFAEAEPLGEMGSDFVAVE